MAYNTRRSGADRGFLNSMSGRGRAMQQNFVSGGQYHNNQKPGVQMGLQQQRSPQQQQFKPSPPFSPQQYSQPSQQQNSPQIQRQPPINLPPAPLKSALKKPEIKPELKPEIKPENPSQQQQQQQQQQEQPEQQTTITPSESVVQSITEFEPKIEENGEIKKKTLIIKGKISKKEKRGRRNKRLRKMLMPKNALMILNELCAGHKFNFIEKDSQNPASPYYVDPDTYVASVTIDNIEHVGYAKSKIGAKTAAAENALRHIVLSKIGSQKSVASTPAGSDSEGESKMDIDGVDNPEDDDVSWLHVASFAMHKLFASWYAEGDEKLEQLRPGMTEFSSHLKEAKAALANVNKANKQRRPAKQLPGNPHLLNPVMLLNQMRDDVVYEECSKDGNPPNIIFTYKTTLDGWEFYGRGGNKKIARRNCAYAACNKIYQLSYPLDEYDPSTGSCNPILNEDNSDTMIIN